MLPPPPTHPLPPHPQTLHSFSQHASWTESSSTLELQVGCRTSWMLLRATVKSWAVPDGDGGTSEATRLGQEAAFCGEAEEAGSDIQDLKKTMAARPCAPHAHPPPTSTHRPDHLISHTSAKTQNTCPLVLFIWGGKEEMRGSSSTRRETTMASNTETMTH